jgi:hypothetical protein
LTTAAVILAALLAVAAVLWVARPFLLGKAAEDAPQPDEAVAEERLRLLEDRDRALAALKDLEFDNRTGKITDADYRELVGPLRREAAAAIAALGDSGPGVEPPPRPAAPPAEEPAARERPREEQPL